MDPVAPGIAVVPVRTPTLAPATHTNTYVVGRGELTVFDPASPYEEERLRLVRVLEERLAAGERVTRVVLTHHHQDHVSGAEALRAALGDVPIAAHAATAELLDGEVAVDEILHDGDELVCGDRTLRATHTPGHAPGHLVFQDLASGAAIAGDMVAGIGTILISPEDGDLGLYLASLERLRAQRPTLLLPAHGPALRQPDALLAFYVAHRHQRTEQIRTALDALGSASPDELAPRVYAELPPQAHKVAAVQIVAHLRWMEAHGLAVRRGGYWALR